MAYLLPWMLLINFAFGWYFPEHALISEKGLENTPVLARKILSEHYRQLINITGITDLCADMNSSFFDVTNREKRLCIPYNTLPALASDHSSSIAELKNLITSQKDISLGLRIVQGVQDHWDEVSKTDLKKISEAKRRSLIRKLDIFLTVVDSEYLTRSENHSTHFAPADEIYTKVIDDLITYGRMDNLLNQFLIHHLRSMQYARLSNYASKDQLLYKWIAFLEHSFAIHFLEDGFASGHIVMFAPYLRPESNFNRLMRHDYFNRNGLVVSRVKSPLSCSYFRLTGKLHPKSDLQKVCWTTFGDGFLNKTDGYDLKFASQAVSHVETYFALALDSKKFLFLLEKNFCTNPNYAYLDEIFKNINPYHSWLSAGESLNKTEWSCLNKQLIIKKAIDSLTFLEKSAPIPEVNANSNTPLKPTIQLSKQIGSPLETCRNQNDLNNKVSIKLSKNYCPKEKGLNLGSPDASLLSGLITLMPITQADKRELFGSDPFSSNFSGQISVGFPLLASPQKDQSVYFGFNFQFGLSYRLEHVIADNPNFGAAELLVGLCNAGQIGQGNPEPLTIANLEFRSALPNFAISYLFKKLYFNLFRRGKPKYQDIVGQFDFTYSFIDGFRYYTQLIQTGAYNKLKAWDVEVFTINFPLNDEIRGVERISRIPSQLRLRMGEDIGTKSLIIGLEFTIGFSRSF